MPFTYSFKGTGSSTAVDTNSFIRKLNRGHGLKCLRVMAGIFSATQTGARYCNAYNYGSTKWSAYRNFLDSKPISYNQLLMSDFSAYQYVQEKLKGSVVKDYKDWAQNATIIEDFTGVKYTKDYIASDVMMAGIDLATEREFMLQYTSVAASLNFYLFAVCLKTLSINSQGISIM